jgi:putative membrane protein
MRVLVWSLKALVFLVFFAFAAKNTEPVSLNLFFGVVWQMPLILLLLAFLAAGVTLALLAVAGVFLRQRRELSRLHKSQSPAPALPPKT